MNTKGKFSVKTMCTIGLMAALTFAATLIQINIPTMLGNTRLHMGNVLCLLSGILLGPVYGGLSAGIGSMFFDLTNPLYISSAPFTFVFKFLMAYVCGKILRRHQGAKCEHIGWNFFAATCGALSYVVLYLGRNFLRNLFFLHAEMETTLIDLATKAPVSLFNAVLAVVVAVPLSIAVRRGLGRAGLLSPNGK